MLVSLSCAPAWTLARTRADAGPNAGGRWPERGPVGPLSPVSATVADAVRLDADAVGYTLYVGSPAQERDFEQYRQVRGDAQRFGTPLIVWSYPRGEAIETKGGKDSFYAVDYAARTASELGAGATGLIFGRKIRPREHGESLRFVAQLNDILARYSSG